MANIDEPIFKYLSQDAAEIVIRKFSFEFPEDLNPEWIPGDPVCSHLFNGLSLTMPYLEPYLIQSTQAAMTCAAHEALLPNMRGFSGRKARRYQCHRRLNELLKANGYPELGDVEQGLARSFEKLSKMSWRTTLGSNA